MGSGCICTRPRGCLLSSRLSSVVLAMRIRRHRRPMSRIPSQEPASDIYAHQHLQALPHTLLTRDKTAILFRRHCDLCRGCWEQNTHLILVHGLGLSVAAFNRLFMGRRLLDTVYMVRQNPMRGVLLIIADRCDMICEDMGGATCRVNRRPTSRVNRSYGCKERSTTRI